MDKKNEKKKESIDEILSDLNGLLNKMPSILDGIKMPDIKPVEFSDPGPAPRRGKTPPVPEETPEVRQEAPAPAPREVTPAPAVPEIPASSPFDKTLILDPFAGLPEGAAAPVEETPVPAEEQPAPAAEQPAQQSLEELLSGDASNPLPEKEQRPEAVKLSGLPLEPPEPKAKAEVGTGKSLSISELNPPEKAKKNTEEAQLEASLEATLQAEPEPSFHSADIFSVEPPAAESPFGLPVAGFEPQSANGSDSAIPDIDALMQMQDAASAPKEEQPAAQAGASEVQEQSAEPVPSVDELAEFEKQLAAAAPGGNMDLNTPKEETPEPSPEPEAQPVEQPAAGLQAAEETLQAEPAAEPVAAQEAFSQPAAEPQAAVPAGEPALSQENQAGGIELSAAPAAENTMELHSADGPLSVAPQAAANPAADETLPGGISLEPRLEISAGIPSESEAEKTVFAPPPPSSDGDEAKTVIFEAGAGPGITSRAQAGDLSGLSRSEPPEGIPAERIRSLYFVYSPEDPALCASLLSELDAICLRSQTTPMFIKRAGVKAFEPGTNANFLAQTVSDTGAKGLVCVGGIPQDKIYEMENAFASSGVYFKHFDSGNFSHSEVLDLLLDLILR